MEQGSSDQKKKKKTLMWIWSWAIKIRHIISFQNQGINIQPNIPDVIYKPKFTLNYGEKEADNFTES